MELVVLSMSSQVIHRHLRLLAMNKNRYISVVYDEHIFIARQALCSDLVQLSLLFATNPWLVTGDFIVIRYHSDRLGSSNA